MSETCDHSNPLIHQGTSQGERMLAALDPANVELHGLNEVDWLQFASGYARLINYFHPDNPHQPAGDWQSFFQPGKDIAAVIKRYGDGNVDPHLALFLSFLKLLTFPQKSLNELPKKHLDFYYRQVLQLREKPYKPDRVHIIFELAKNAGDELVDVNVPLNAGKDSEGNPLIYKTTTPLVVNHGKIASIKSVFPDRQNEGKEILRYALKTNSVDGIEENLEKDQHWSAFGNKQWPETELGFYIASDLLWLKEGRREISLNFKLASGLTLPKSHIKASITGEDEWIDVTISSSSRTNSAFNFILDLVIDTNADPVSAYSEDIHESHLPAVKPVLKIVFIKPDDYPKLKNAAIDKLHLEVNVFGVESLQLQNELGNIDPSKPFMPFGSRPKIGSRLSLIYPEMSEKPISRIELEMQWLNIPVNFSLHYKHYGDAINEQKKETANNSSNLGNYSVLAKYKDEATLAGEHLMYQTYFLEVYFIGGTPPDNMKGNFKARLETSYDSASSEFELFSNLPQASLTVSGTPKKVPKGKMNMVLTESFYHDLYPKIYTNAVLTADGKEADLPNEPYTPLIDQLLLNYTASEEISFTAAEPSSVMFHQHPFGTKQVDALNKKLVPEYENNELYIGLENVTAGSNISLLFQVASGSENPKSSSFDEGDIDWWVLAGNNWHKIDEKDFARNQTNNFLRSGIVELTVPKTAGTDNSLLDTGLHWLRIRLKKEMDSVSKFISIKSQAAEAIFDNRDNSTSHLDSGIPGETIGKLVNPRARIKSILQPYASFDGEPAEVDTAFYRRVSERLRHKNRTVSIRDYESIVLEQFSSLYKVKCLNHSHWNGNTLDQMSPGNVTLVLIPKITEDNTEFRLEPAVSRNFIFRVEEFVNSRGSVHTAVTAANAVYEQVRFDFEIRFNPGLDYNFHKKQVIADLRRLMAPWVFELDAAIEFGGSFTEYQVINFLENLGYVDFISGFKMFHKPLNGEFTRKPIAEPSIPMAILIPVFDENKITEAQRCD